MDINLKKLPCELKNKIFTYLITDDAKLIKDEIKNLKLYKYTINTSCFHKRYFYNYINDNYSSIVKKSLLNENRINGLNYLIKYFKFSNEKAIKTFYDANIDKKRRDKKLKDLNINIQDVEITNHFPFLNIHYNFNDIIYKGEHIIY